MIDVELDLGLPARKPELSLETARKILAKKAVLSGVPHCLCCGQVAKVYPRTLYATPCFCLMRFYRHAFQRGIKKYHHLLALVKADPMVKGLIPGGDFQKAFHWNLIEPKPKSKD